MNKCLGHGFQIDGFWNLQEHGLMQASFPDTQGNLQNY
jgi:hypothetical protein